MDLQLHGFQQIDINFRRHMSVWFLAIFLFLNPHSKEIVGLLYNKLRQARRQLDSRDQEITQLKRQLYRAKQEVAASKRKAKGPEKEITANAEGTEPNPRRVLPTPEKEARRTMATSNSA